MNTYTSLIASRPLLFATVFFALGVVIFFLLWYFYLGRTDRQLSQEYQTLQREVADLKAQAGILEKDVNSKLSTINELESELRYKDELLQATSKTVVESKQALDRAADTYNDIRSDTREISATELRTRLCQLYPEECK